jgi:hypothetical protein
MKETKILFIVLAKDTGSLLVFKYGRHSSLKLKITKSVGYFTSGLIFVDRVEGFGNGNVKKLGNLNHWLCFIQVLVTYQPEPLLP